MRLRPLALREKKTYSYRERDETKRKLYLKEVRELRASQLVYLDEAGIDDTDDYGYGWCYKGERFYATRKGTRKERVSFISAWHQAELVAPLTDEGYCNRAVFEAWLEQTLLPSLL